MTPTTPIRSSGTSPGAFTRRTRGQPELAATFASATVLEELAEPSTIMASQREARAFTAVWRLVVA